MQPEMNLGECIRRQFAQRKRMFEWCRITEELRLGYNGINCPFGCEYDSIGLEQIFNSIESHKDDAPDMISIVDKFLIPIEHFEFDCGHKSNNGSKFKKDESDFVKSLSKNDIQGNLVQITKKMDIHVSSQQYIDNITNVFVSHYHKIDSYRENISKEFKGLYVAKTWFFIEDALPFVVSYKNSPLRLFEVKQFIDLLEQSSNLGGIIYKVNDYEGKPTIHMLKNSKATIAYLRKKQVDIEKIELSLSDISMVVLVADSNERLEGAMRSAGTTPKA